MFKCFTCILHGKRAFILSENEIPAPNLISCQALFLSLSEKQNAELGNNHFLHSKKPYFYALDIYIMKEIYEMQ